MSNTSAETPEEGKQLQLLKTLSKQGLINLCISHRRKLASLEAKVVELKELLKEGSELVFKAVTQCESQRDQNKVLEYSLKEDAETIKRYKALVSAQEGYIQFLSHHIDSQTQFMAIHNQFTSVEDVERGIQFRESIAAAKSALSGTNE